MKTRFILIHTSHAGNVGAAARAIRTMGFDELVLVAPRWPDVLEREETIERASGALDVLAKARVVGSLDEALDGMQHLCGTAMVPRDFGPPTRTPRQHFDWLCQIQTRACQPCADADGDADGTNDGPPSEAPAGDLPQGVAFLFGSERFGMRNEDVYRCHVALQIPSDPEFGSLNLAAAVQLIAYEWRLHLEALGLGYAGSGALQGAQAPQGAQPEPLADAQATAAMLVHWQQALEAIGFLDPAAPKKLMPRLGQLFNRAGLTEPEIHILRGIAKTMLQTRRAPRS
ncbi:RNA methyltransferase [Corticibacter populi]|uniref:RNA methyltransferase n=1 Tax=Corticibacter populi TaxID=1550736 RepID=A0A3M6QZ21_9BURK|nr:RNA methyltransferase [Corticibacter populi]RMX07879.1 RNA methyltransferase [Corticibacter populi]RZS35119.1 tRNA/rRNA methyltransferase [Corticibacter populi]